MKPPEQQVDLLSTKIPLVSAISAIGVVISILISFGSSYMTEKGIDKSIQVQLQSQNVTTEKRLDYNTRSREDLENRTKTLEIDNGKIGTVVTMMQKDLEDVKKDGAETKRMVFELVTAKRLEDAKRNRRESAAVISEPSSDYRSNQ